MFARNRSKMTLLAPLVAVAVTLVAACSTSNNSAAGGSGSSNNQETLTFAASISAEDMPVFVAAKYGYFKKEGIDFQQTTTLAGNATRTALLSGSIDMITSDAAAAAALDVSLPLTVIAAAYDAQGIELVVAKKYQKTAPPGVGGLAGLKGLKIGVVDTGGSTEFVPQRYFAENGYGSNFVTFVPLGNSAAMLPALESGRVDAISYSDPIVTELVDQGLGYVQTNFGAQSNFWPAQIIVTSQKFYQSHVDLMNRADAAIVAADERLSSDHAFAVQAVEAILSISNSKVASDIVNNDLKYWAPTLTAQGWNNAVAYEEQTKAISEPISFSSITNSQLTKIWATADQS
jgi:ABC-type nitrate/sulfonate/bicarbonate transport system substrate-binding protein